MKKKIILILLVSVALSSILFINLGNKSAAQECNDCTPIPTEPGEAEYCKMKCDSSEAIPTIKASASTIASGGSITLWVDSGGLACPDFTWSVSSAKYTLNKSKTKNDLETVTMTAASGTCGSGYTQNNNSVTITVTDNCGATNQIIIRNTVGRWASWGGCSGGLTTLYTHPYIYRTNSTTGITYRYQLKILSGGSTVATPTPPACTPQFPEKAYADWYTCLVSEGAGSVPQATINDWIDEVLGSSGLGPFKVCRENFSWACMSYLQCSTCNNASHTLAGWSANIWYWSCP